MYWLAFISGLISSLHCIGMCGPIMLVLVPNKNNLIHWVLYNFGRTITYIILGFLLGALGSVFVFAGWQQFLSIGAGILLIFFALSQILGKYWQLNFFQNYLFSKISVFLKSTNPFSKFIIGMLNGFLPCGMVYTAFAGAIATADIKKAAIFMGIFGLGTMPLMLLLAMFKNQLKGKLEIKFNQFTPYYMLIISILIIVRGLNLNIPYLSPQAPTDVKASTKIELHCAPTTK